MARRLAAVLLLGVFWGGEIVCADETKLNAKFALWHEYNSNIYFSPKDEKGDFITRTKAGLEWLNRTERSEIFLVHPANAGVFSWMKYSLSLK